MYTFPVRRWWNYWWVLDCSINEVQAHSSLANPTRLPTILAIGQTLVTFQMTFPTSEASRPDPLRLVSRSSSSSYTLRGIRTSSFSCHLCILLLFRLDRLVELSGSPLPLWWGTNITDLKGWWCELLISNQRQ